MPCYLLLLLIIFGTSSGFNPASYEHSEKILPRYEVYWTVNLQDSTLSLALHVQTTGWVGFGIAEVTSGSMPGSDIVLGAVHNGKGTITDRWASQFTLPAIDDCQDWVLVSASESEGYTTLELKRLLDTKDAQDRAIVPGANRIVVAFGEDGIDDPSYHSANRLTSELTFYGTSSKPSLPSDAMFIDLRMPNFSVPNGFTNYICTSFSLPIDKQYSVIQIDPLIEQANVAHVHHFIAHICTNVTGGYVTGYQTPGDCFSPVGDSDSGCDDIIMAWAAGGGPTVLPDDVGFAMGPSATSAQFIVMEIHYNNPSGFGGYTDTSGIRIWYTDRIRKHEAGILVVGDVIVNLPPIPALAVTEYETECPSECTKTLNHDLYIWQSYPHMHQVGSQIWTSQWRNDTLVAEIGRIEYWSFDHQQTQFVNYTLRPGDRLNTHCVYDTRGKSSVTNFGLNSTDEMCMHFLGYWPRTPIGSIYCGYLTPEVTVCGDNVMVYPNPSILDPKGGANRTFGTVASTPACQPPPLSLSQATRSHAYLFCIVLFLYFLL